MIPAAAIFDLDGTLVDSVADVGFSLNATLIAWGRPALELDQIRPMMGEGAKALLQRAFAATGGAPSDPGATLSDFQERYAARPIVGTCLYPGALAVLTRLRGKGVPLGLCTNKPERITRLVLDGLGLTPFFAAMTGGDTFAFRKPDGRHILETLARMGTVTGPVIYVGDSLADAQAAKAAGVPMIAVSFGYGGDVSTLGADRVIDDYGQFDAALESI